MGRPRPRGTVNLRPRRIRSLQVGASNSPGTAVIALFSSPSTSRVVALLTEEAAESKL